MMSNFFSGKMITAAMMVAGLAGACAKEQPSTQVAHVHHTSGSSTEHVTAQQMNANAPMTCDNAPVFFASGSSNLDDTGRGRLDALSNCLRNRTLSEVIITGRADPRGNEQENQSLSARRTETVANYLRDRGITNVTLTMRAEGEVGAVNDPALYPYQRNAHVQVRPAEQPANNR